METKAMVTAVLAGASGYSYKPWKGNFYPADLQNASMLAYYAQRLPTVEINNTFYRLPKKAVLESWSASTPANFRFVLKASRRITHMQRLKETGELTDYLFETADSLGTKLGPILFQLPPNLKKDLERLRRFLSGLAKERAVAFEFRHESWFEDDVFDALREHNAALCLADVEDQEDTEPELVATANWGYLRLRRDDYQDADLTRWLARIRQQPWAQAYVFFKHEDAGAAPKMAQRLNALADDVALADDGSPATHDGGTTG
ncbi:MAG: DUF72 domain-containing protein [Pseudomonadota bacterium]